METSWTMDATTAGAQASLCVASRRRLEIRGLRRAQPGAAELVEWLSTRPEVAAAVFDPDSGRLDLHLARDPAPLFVASVRDRLFVLGAPRPSVGHGHLTGPRARPVSVRRAVHGRARLAVSGPRADELPALAAWIARLPGVKEATASRVTPTLLVLFDPGVTSAAALAEAASSAPDPLPAPEAPRERGTQEGGSPLVLALNTAVLAASVAEVLPVPVLLPAVVLTAIPSFRRAVKAFREGRATVDALDTAAIVSALVTGEAATAAFMTWLLGLGDLLLERTQERARRALSSLVQLDTAEAFRVEQGRVERVAAGDLRQGDRVVVAAGQRVPADAEIESGAASVDEKALTGESVPHARHAGDTILAATVVVDGEIVARVTRAGTETTAARIVQILEEAGSRPMTLQRTIERSADRLVWPTILTAVGAAALSGDVTRLTSVLINDFGTGIRIAVPTNALTAITLASRSGVLIKGAAYLELLARADVVVFDKTGTLTVGEPAVVDVVPLGALGGPRVVALAAAAEARKAHPIAAAVLRRAAMEGVEVAAVGPGDVRFVVGRGVAARVEGRDVLVGSARWLHESGVATGAADAVLARHRAAGVSTLLCAVDGALEGAIGYADEPRAESASVVAALKAGGRRRTVLLSGDAREVVLAVGRSVGVDEAHGELLPEDKAAFVEELKKQGRIVAMVGDGINDAPALTAADVGISLHGSTDVALEAADVVLLEGGLSRLHLAFESGEHAMRRVRQGVGLVVAPNAAAIVLGALGLINPAIATVANNGSTLVAAVAGLLPLLRTPQGRPE